VTDGAFLSKISKKNKKSDRCLEELLEIAEIIGINTDVGVKKRKEALNKWISRWIYEYSHDQAYIKTNFSEEEKKFIQEYSKNVIINELMEECVNVEDSKTHLKMKVRAIKSQ